MESGNIETVRSTGLLTLQDRSDNQCQGHCIPYAARMAVTVPQILDTLRCRNEMTQGGALLDGRSPGNKEATKSR